MIRFLSILIIFEVVTAAQELPFHYYSTADGLNQSQITKIYQDHLGYIWFSTCSGIDRYDGIRYEHFTFYEHIVRTIFEDSRHRIWFATSSEGVYLLPAAQPTTPQLQHIDMTNGLRSNAITSIAEDQEQNIWLGSFNQGLSYLIFENDSLCNIQHVTLEVGLVDNSIITLFVDNLGALWCGTSGGLSRISRDNQDILHIVNYTEESGLPPAKIFSIVESADSTIWCGTSDGIYYRHRHQKKFSPLFDQNNSLCNLDTRALYFDHQNHFWVGTNGDGVLQGIYDTTRNQWQFNCITTANGLPTNRVFNIMEDREHNLWFGTWGNGACKLLSNGFIKITRFNGRPLQGVYSISEDKSGNYWVGTDGNGVVLLQNEQMKNYDLNNGLGSNSVWSIEIDSQEQVWLGTLNGLKCYIPQTSRFLHFSTDDGLPGNNVVKVFVDSKNHLWISCLNQGLVVYPRSPVQNGLKRKFETRHFMSETAIYSILETQSGEIWLGTSIGAFRLGKVTADIGDFKPQPTPVLPDKPIWCINEDDQKRLWFGSNGFGLYCFDGESIKRFTTREGLCDNTIYFIQADNQNRHWIGTNRGINLVRFTADSLEILQHFSTRDGMASNETNANCSVLTKNQQLWFGTVAGISKFSLTTEKTIAVPPLIYITSLRYTKFQIPLQQPINLKHKQNYLTFSYLGLNFRDEAGLKYQYMLEGFETDWSELTQQREIRYTMLEPGNYTFKVRALNSDGIWSREAATLPFQITPPWWQTTIARISALLLSLLIIFGLYEIRVRQMKRSRRKLREKINERTQELAASEQKYRTLIESSCDIIFTLDARGIFRTVNSTFQEKLGIRPEQLIGASSFDFVPTAVNRRLQEKIQTALKGKVVTFEWSHVANHKTTDLETTLSPIRKNGDKIVGVVGISRDVTERFRMARELKAERDKLRTILEAMEDMVMISAPDFRILYVNRAFQKTFPEINVGFSCKELFRTVLGHQDSESILHNISSCGESQEYLDRKHHLWLGVISCPINLPEGECQLYILRDITERRYLEQERLNTERLSAVAQTTIAYNHEINNPLFGIMGYLEIMMQEEKDSKRHEELTLIYDAAKRIADVTQRLKRLTRPAIREYVGSVKMLDLSGTNPGDN